MTAEVPHQRWKEAQQAEAEHWATDNLTNFFWMFHDYREYLDHLGNETASSLFDGKEVLEIGVGQYRLSPVSLYLGKSSIKRLVKAEPLAPKRISECSFAETDWLKPFVNWVESLSNEGEYVQLSGEEIAYKEEFDTVLLVNMLDHVRDPLLVMRNAHQALRRGGKIAVLLDCYSLVGRLRFRYLTSLLYKDSVLVRAHPHQFCLGHVISLLETAGFNHIRTVNVPGYLQKIFGKHYRGIFLADK